MPTVSLLGCACATPAIASTANITMARGPRPEARSPSVPIDPPLRVDPLLQLAQRHAAGLRALPGVVRILGPAEQVVDDAEIDERLRRVAAERLELAELVLAERERGAVERDPPLLIGGRRFL